MMLGGKQGVNANTSLEKVHRKLFCIAWKYKVLILDPVGE